MSSESRPEVVESRVVEAEIVPAEEAPDPASLGIDLPEDPEEAIRLLLRRLAEARGEATSYLDDLKRVAADFDNYRKRTTREQAAILDRAAERVVRELMPVLDSFDAALSTQAESEAEHALFSGLLNTREQLLKALEKEGLEVIPTIDETFDPNIHEAIEAPEGVSDLVVAEEARRGYRLKGKVLRPAMVRLEGRQ